MCGINLIIDRSKKIGEQAIQAMNAATHHRGPDYTGIKVVETASATYYLGYNRLKILDLSDNGNQPMSDPTGRYHLVFNGEIYNYVAKGQELQKKCLSHTDTEVLLYWLIEFGIEKIDELQGMFAFAFLDVEKDELIIARGGTGQKPLYTYESEEVLMLSSEIKGIIASGLAPKQINKEAIPHYLSYKYIKRPYTIYNNIFECEPGEFLQIKSGKLDQKKRFESSPKPKQEKIKSQTILNQVEALLLESVEKHLQGDVPKALLLSGGVDSTLMLSLLNELGQTPMTCYCITGSAKRKSFLTGDLPYAVSAAKQYGGKLQPIVVTDNEFQEEYQQFVKAMDQPIADSAAFLTWKLCHKIHPEDKILISGAGGDELFGGYNRHSAYWFYLKNLQKSGLNRGLLSAFSDLFPEGKNTLLRKQFRLINRFSAGIDKDEEITFKNFSSLQFPFQHEKEWDHQKKPMYNALQHDFNHYLISDILALNDKMGMSASKEIRSPYLFQPLVKYMHSLPPENVMLKGRKWVLNKLLEKRKGLVYTKRHKEGFGLPFGDWFKENMYYADTILKNNSKISDMVDFNTKEVIKDMVMRHQRGKKDYTTELWALFHLATWLETH